MEIEKLAIPAAALLVVTVAGFFLLNGNSRGPDALPESTCNAIEMQVNHYQGENQRTRFVYRKNLEADRVSVEWVFSNGNVTRQIDLEENSFDSENYYTVTEVDPEGSFEYLRVNPVGCPEKAFRFPPEEA